MSILDTFNQLRDDKQSLETLASLPQTLIMNMVQRKEIPQENLPMIMAKKAEMAQTTANMKAAQSQQQQQGQAGTIIEQLMAQNAAEEATRSQAAPNELTDVGIASNPVPEMRMAGGGIVAFARGDLVEETPETNAEIDALLDPDYARKKRQSDAWSKVANNKNPYLAEDFRRDVRGIVDPIKGFFTAPFDKAAADSAKKAEVVKLMKDKNLSAADAVAFQGAKNMQTADSPEDYDMYNPKKVERMAPVVKKDQAQTQTQANLISPKAAPTVQEERKSIFDEYKKLYADDAEASKTARNDAKWNRIMEAGLNIMGGESPYAFANIGKGGAAAAKGYAEDVKGLRAEERDRKKQLTALGMKEKEFALDERKLDITDKRYGEMSDIERQKIGILKQQNLDQSMATQVERNFATLMSEYKSSLDRGDMTVSDLYRMAQENVASTRGLKSKTPAPEKIPTYDPNSRTFK